MKISQVSFKARGFNITPLTSRDKEYFQQKAKNFDDNNDDYSFVLSSKLKVKPGIHESNYDLVYFNKEGESQGIATAKMSSKDNKSFRNIIDELYEQIEYYIASV